MLSRSVPWQDGSGSALSHLHCSTVERQNSSTPVLFLQVVLVFMAFDFAGCFGLALLLTFLPLLSQNEPGFAMLSLLPFPGDVAGVGIPNTGDPVPQHFLVALKPPDPVRPPRPSPLGVA